MDQFEAMAFLEQRLQNDTHGLKALAIVKHHWNNPLTVCCHCGALLNYTAQDVYHAECDDCFYEVFQS